MSTMERVRSCEEGRCGFGPMFLFFFFLAPEFSDLAFSHKGIGGGRESRKRPFSFPLCFCFVAMAPSTAGRPMLIARRLAAAAASAANDSLPSMLVASARSVIRSAATTTTTTSSFSSSSLRPKPSSSRSFASLPSFEEDVGQPTHETHPEVRDLRRGKSFLLMKDGKASCSSVLSFFLISNLVSRSLTHRSSPPESSPQESLRSRSPREGMPSPREWSRQRRRRRRATTTLLGIGILLLCGGGAST